MARRHPYSNEDFFSTHVQQSANDDMIEQLRSRVGQIKELSLDIGEEIREQNGLISDLDHSFDGTWGMLHGMVDRVKKLTNAGHNRYILYLILFSLFVFFVIWLIIRF